MKKLMLVAAAAILTVCSVMAQPPQREQIPVEKQVEQLKEQLDLSAEQCEKVTNLLENQKEPERGNREAMEEAMKAREAAMKEILTEEQFKSWTKMMEEQRAQRGGGRPQR